MAGQSKLKAAYFAGLRLGQKGPQGRAPSDLAAHLTRDAAGDAVAAEVLPGVDMVKTH